jgi:hypothetical protein
MEKSANFRLFCSDSIGSISEKAGINDNIKQTSIMIEIILLFTIFNPHYYINCKNQIRI